jgi:hypothetical protein
LAARADRTYGNAARSEQWGHESLRMGTVNSEPSRAEWSFRLPLVKDGIEWGWLNFYHSMDGEALLVDTNYLSDLLRREFTDAAARIFTDHEEQEVAPAMAMSMAAKG